MFALTTLVDGAAAVSGVPVDCQHLSLLAEWRSLWTRGGTHYRKRKKTHLLFCYFICVCVCACMCVSILQMWAKQQLLSALVLIKVWSSLQVGTADSQSSESHSVTNRNPEFRILGKFFFLPPANHTSQVTVQIQVCLIFHHRLQNKFSEALSYE